ncbi:hypothetical protein N7520_006466 [Penicillium odoratum]|uniref:uncharacterized protein n=1 Tax=Penicillium odoratum TaxID=1167516 RepID=UPI0025485391|nr:uncharacterized protein N7520_006466 [Penicillium odoratum]KAJ5759310.1 hypothetical protein N7520_006466 [Penicillium odoratum]
MLQSQTPAFWSVDHQRGWRTVGNIQDRNQTEDLGSLAPRYAVHPAKGSVRDENSLTATPISWRVSRTLMPLGDQWLVVRQFISQ